MKKGLIIQGIKTKTSVSVFVSTLFYVFLASFFIEGGLCSVVNWWDHFPLQ